MGGGGMRRGQELQKRQLGVSKFVDETGRSLAVDDDPVKGERVGGLGA